MANDETKRGMKWGKYRTQHMVVEIFYVYT